MLMVKGLLKEKSDETLAGLAQLHSFYRLKFLLWCTESGVRKAKGFQDYKADVVEFVGFKIVRLYCLLPN